ncbi:MAG: 16S rRNA (guanine(966)-N(2))-methyltransferase RsmD [Parachlamydiaceae bacterium]|nr:16S rRNA (guanine(966)-N(2))-methyltransferase RsmD [Parachlamydiaceae bacterium]
MRIVSGIFKNRTLLTPKGLDTRPTSERMRATLFNICQNYIENARFLDLFAGSGAIGLEALSRGASHATFVDMSKESCLCIKKNIASLNAQQQTTVLHGDVLAQLKRLPHQYDIIFVDPPYELNLGTQVLAFVDQNPILTPTGTLFIEESAYTPPEVALTTLELVSSRSTGRTLLQQYRKRT